MKTFATKKKLDSLLAACKKNLHAVDERLIEKAYYFSLSAHKDHLRASGDVYFNHPYEVALIVATEIPLDDVSVASALLHDILEETDYQFNDLKEEFGPTVANIVNGVTKISGVFESTDVAKHEDSSHQVENYRKLLLSMVSDIRVMLVKFADRLHNMRTLEYLSIEKQRRIAQETLDIYAGFAHRFGLATIKWELEDLAFKYLHPKDYDELSRLIVSKRRERETYLKKFILPIEKELKDAKYNVEIFGRPKHLYSIYNKMKTQAKPMDEIYDLYAVRIILDTEIDNECYSVYGLVSAIYSPVPERFKNYIAVPKKNGYQSLHTAVIGPQGKMVEVQIRTKLMHEIAERGVAAHWKYKGVKSNLDQDIEQWLNWVREIFEHADSDSSPEQLLESVKLNLYQNEIYVFTPKGELKILPQGATPMDFAFEVHTNVGMHCIGAKVNGKIVPLDTKLRSGDQIEIITSKNQTPSPDWEKVVVTHKAKQKLRKLRRESEHSLAQVGKEMFERRAKKLKISYSDDELQKIISDFKFETVFEMYLSVQDGKTQPDEILLAVEQHRRNIAPQHPEQPKTNGLFSSFVQTARQMISGITFFGSENNVLHNFAKCCNPIPGDDIVGFVTVGEGIKIHRKNCRNIVRMGANEIHRIVEVSWPTASENEFAAAVKISGSDRHSLVNDLTNVISTFNNTNIRSINIDSREGNFDGLIVLGVKDIEHLQRLIEKMREVKGVRFAARFEEL
ncbi:MAG: bifunctional (p)ppGpp synthetase/guanosine-3',5'-bis(diphosphate) 3'-pyrophosphohydrolase [Ignavibacteriales bacterium]|nr:bifunctional (p)ppGpp synthetase/guanosine-3',5'-bis(diphosphate) 3'-pyrophosphohydrolase [Ignavibacteriales bacterium]